MQELRHSLHLPTQLGGELGVRSNHALGRDERAELRACEGLHQLKTCRRLARERPLADVALVVPGVAFVKGGVCRLRHENHPLPPSEAGQMDPALISTAETRRDERPGLDALEAVATKYFILLLPHMSDVLAGGDPLEEHLLGCGFTCLSEQKPDKEQERGRRAEKRAQREGRR